MAGRINPIRHLAFQKSGSEKVRDYLSNRLEIDNSEMSGVREIAVASSDMIQPYEISGNRISLRPEIVNEIHQSVFQGELESAEEAAVATATELEIEADDFSLEDSGQYVGMSDEENRTFFSLGLVKNVLRRVFNRRNGLLSWIFAGYTKLTGLSSKGNLDIDEFMSPEFARKLAAYEKAAEGKTRGEKKALLRQTFKEGRELTFAKVTLRTKHIGTEMPDIIRENFPRGFAIANIVTPWLEYGLNKMGLESAGHFFGWLKVANPFIDEFLSTYTGLCGDELEKLKENANLEKDNSIQSLEVDAAGKEEHLSPVIRLGNLDSDAGDLRIAKDEFTSAFARLFARPRNFSGMIMHLTLKYRSRYKDYKDLDKTLLQDPNLLEGIYKHINSLGDNPTLTEVLNVEGSSEIFNPEVEDNKHKIAAAKFILGGMAAVNSTPQGLVEKGPKWFGLPYSFIYLGLPIVTKFLGEESFVGKCIAWIQRITPLVNDCCIDVISSAFDEVNTVKKAFNQSPEQFKKLPSGKGVVGAAWKALRDSLGKLKPTTVSDRPALAIEQT